MDLASSSTANPSARAEAVRAVFRARVESCVLGRLAWVKTEAADDPATWSRARRDAIDYLQMLFAGGALSGTTPAQAYDVVCDDKTMRGAPAGQLHVIVGAAPLRPAELELIHLLIPSASATRQHAARSVSGRANVTSPTPASSGSDRVDVDPVRRRARI